MTRTADRPTRRASASVGSTALMNSSRLAVPTSGASPPISGWMVTSASGPSFVSSSTQSAGVTTANCGIVFIVCDVGDRWVGRGADAALLGPLGVRVRRVHHVRADDLPAAVGIVGDEQEQRTLGARPAGHRLAELPALLGVHLVEGRRGRHEVVAVPGGADRRRLGRATDVDRRARLLHRCRQDLDRHPPVLERLAAPGLLEDGDRLLEDAHPLRLLDAEHRRTRAAGSRCRASSRSGRRR